MLTKNYKLEIQNSTAQTNIQGLIKPYIHSILSLIFKIALI